MKKLIIGMMAAAFALVAFCEGDDNNSPIVSDSNPNPLIVSDNAFGSIKVETSSEFTMVAVPFEGFASQFEPGQTMQNQILARDAIAVEMLHPSDMMSIHNPNATDPTEEFDNYFASLDTWKVGRETYKAMSWSTSGWFAEETMTGYASPEADQRLVGVGSGVFIGRGANSPKTFDIYAYGQIPQSFPWNTAVNLPKGKTMLSAPGEMSYKSVNLNDLDWGNVSSSDLTGGIVVQGERVQQAYGGVQKVLRGTSIPDDADVIVFYTTDQAPNNNTLANRRDFCRYDGRWVRMINPTVASLDDDAVIPAGMSFWYLRNTASSEGALLKWRKAD